MSGSGARLALLSDTKRKLFEASRQAGQSRPVTAAQRRLWFFQRVNPDSCVYHNVHVLRFRGPLDAELLVRCFREVVRRHESLRTRFAERRDAGGSNESGSELIAFVSPSLQVDVRALDVRAELETQIVDRLARPPFDLAAGPLVRAALLRFDRAHHAFVLVVHHIVSDRWSFGILEAELATLYRAGGEAQALPPLRAAYAQSVRELPDGETERADLAYWRTHLAGDRPTLHVPADHPRPAQPSYRGAVFATVFEPALVEAVTRIGAAERVTPFVTLLAAFCVLLHRRSFQSDLTIGTPVAGRSRTEQERPIGLYVNTLPLRLRISPAATFRELLASVRTVVLDLLAHQAVPFDRLVRELLAERDPSRNPFFDVLFDFHNTPRDARWPAQLQVEAEDFDLGVSRLDLSLVLRPERDGSLTCRFEYALDLFDPPSIATLASQLRTLLETIARDEALALDRLPLEIPCERETKLEAESVPATARISRAPTQLPPPAGPGEASAAPFTDIERRVAAIVEQLLDIEQARRNDDFFSLGGHSLLATRVIARIAEAFGVEVSLRSFFATPTVAGLAELVASAPPSAAASLDDTLDARLATLSDADVDALLAQTLRGRTRRFRCVLLGHTSLAERCADVLRRAGHDVVAVLVPERGEAASAQERRACERRLRAVLGTGDIDYLFSVVNAIVLDSDLLALARHGAINLHDAPLPRYAGCHATTWAIAAQELVHGVTWHEMTGAVDAGPILKARAVPLENDTAFSLNVKCYEAALDAFEELVSNLERGDVQRREQDLSQRSYFARAKRPSPACLVDWSQSASAVDAFVRALDFERTVNPLGRPKFFIGDAAYVCARLERVPERTVAVPGTIVRLEDDGLVVAAQGELVKLRAVSSLAGEPIVPAQLVARHALVPGMTLRSLHELPLAAIERADMVAIAHEPYWLARLEQLEPLVLADFERNDEAAPLARTPIARGGADEYATLAAFALHASSAGAGGAFDLGLALPDTRSPVLAALFASSVPLRVRPQLASLDAVARDLRREAAETARRGTFTTDILTRYPQLVPCAGVLRAGTLPVVVSLGDVLGEDCALCAAALTLAIAPAGGGAELRYRLSASARRAAETISSDMAAILGARS